MRKRSNRAGCVERDVTASGTPTATAPGHQGDISLLQDGVVPAPGSQNDAQQYDTYTGDGGVEAQSIGYSFDSMQMLTKLTYTEGMHFSKPGILSFAPGSPTAATKACCLQTTAAGGPRRRWWR